MSDDSMSNKPDPGKPVADLPDEGPLGDIAVPHLLAQAWRDRRSGRLELSHGEAGRSIEVDDGAPVLVESNPARDEFARFLEDTGQISTRDRLAIERLAEERGCPQPQATLAIGTLDATRLYGALRKQARQQIAETFDWRGGFYRWTPAGPDVTSKAKPHDILGLLQAELPRRWGTDRLFQAAVDFQDLRGDLSPRMRRVAQKLAQASPHAERALARLDGSRALGQVLGECAGEPEAASTLWVLIHSGLFRIGGSSPRSMSGEAIDFEIEVTGESSARRVAGAAPTKSAAQAGRDSDKASALRLEIENLLGQVETTDHYSALGLDEAATPALIKKAYFKAAKRYHPDALARLGLDDLKAPAAKVFARIAEAFETLSDPDKRRAYDAGGSEEPEIDTARLAQAETSFRKGEILVKMGNFGGALEYLEPAVELWPEEPAYQAGLGWALYKQPNTDLERATRHLEAALERAPDDAVTLFRLGVVAKASGDAQRAAALIARARSIDPTVSE